MTFMIITYAYLFTRKEGLGVMLARNGSGVLRVMISSAASKGSPKTHSFNLEAFTRSIPWLPAYDWRDIVTIANIFQEVLQQSGSLLVMKFEAIALSVYYSAILFPGSGDAINGRSLRQWLGDYGIHINLRRKRWLDEVPPIIGQRSSIPLPHATATRLCNDGPDHDEI